MVIANMPLVNGSSSNNPKLLVIHAMGEIIRIDQEAHDWYASKGKHVPIRDYHAYEWLAFIGLSAHNLISPNGMVTKCREDNRGAYHAKGFNTDSLGVEFLVKGIHNYGSLVEIMKTDWLSTFQFNVGIELVQQKMNRWNLQLNNITTHHKLDPDRKQDPGIGFPLNEFITSL